MQNKNRPSFSRGIRKTGNPAYDFCHRSGLQYAASAPGQFLLPRCGNSPSRRGQFVQGAEHFVAALTRSAHGIRRILRFVILSGVERSRRIFAPNVCIAVTKVRRFFDSLTLAQNDSFGGTVHQLDKLEFTRMKRCLLSEPGVSSFRLALK